ncbi:hypothetical protein APS67_003493 [Streptomyces sp. AVP053U2]|nr:hypothetical protein APS67_003493 [Streptomyces sp. AVP053U2]
MACVVASQDLRTSVVYRLRTLAIAACCYAAGRLGLTRELVIEGAVVSPIWPPTGVAVAALLVFGLRYWPGVALGALGVLLSLTSLTWRSFVILAGNTAAPVCGCLLLRAVGFRTDLARLRDGVALVFLGAFAAMLVSSSVAAGLLISTGELPGPVSGRCGWPGGWGTRWEYSSSPRSCSCSTACAVRGAGHGGRRPWG